MQSKKLSALEALSNTIIGLFISYIATTLLYWILNIPVSHQQNLIITAVMFIISIVRGYVVRRIFNKIG
jgi:high-affinity Fe2+/Pb2+ permease